MVMWCGETSWKYGGFPSHGAPNPWLNGAPWNKQSFLGHYRFRKPPYMAIHILMCIHIDRFHACLCDDIVKPHDYGYIVESWCRFLQECLFVKVCIVKYVWWSTWFMITIYHIMNVTDEWWWGVTFWSKIGTGFIMKDLWNNRFNIRGLAFSIQSLGYQVWIHTHALGISW